MPLEKIRKIGGRFSTLRPKHRAYYRSGRPVITIGPKGALGSHEIRPIHSAPSLGQSIDIWRVVRKRPYFLNLPEKIGYLYDKMFFFSGLFRIEISRNNLSDVTPEAFVGLENSLRQLDLHSNHLTAVPSRSFRHLSRLQLLNLTGWYNK